MALPRKEFGKWLKDKRIKSSWSQEELAKQLSPKTGYNNSIQHISRLENGQIELDRQEVEAIASIFGEDPFLLLAIAGILDPNLRQAIINNPSQVRRVANINNIIKISVPFSIAALPFASLQKFFGEEFSVNVFPTSYEVLQDIVNNRVDLALMTDNNLKRNVAKFVPARDYHVIGEASNDKLIGIFKVFYKPISQSEWQSSKQKIGFLKNSAGEEIACNLRRGALDNRMHIRLTDSNYEHLNLAFGDYEAIGFDSLAEIAEALINKESTKSIAAVVAWFPARIRLLQFIATKYGNHIPSHLRLKVANAAYYEFKREKHASTDFKSKQEQHVLPPSDFNNSFLPKRNLLLIVSNAALERLPHGFFTSFAQTFDTCRKILKEQISDANNLDPLFNQLNDIPGFEFCSMNWWQPDPEDDEEIKYKTEIKKLFRSLIQDYDFELLLKASTIFQLKRSLW